jgi:hypothetical protein
MSTFYINIQYYPPVHAYTTLEVSSSLPCVQNILAISPFINCRNYSCCNYKVNKASFLSVPQYLATATLPLEMINS